MMAKYEIKSDHDAMLPQAPIDYLITNLITNSSVNVFYGEPGSKKTYSMLNLGIAVANGKKWLGFVTKKYPVLYIDEESGQARFTRRLKEVMNGLSCQTTGDFFFTSLAGFKLESKQDISDIETEITKRGIRLVIFDALADIMNGDENSKKDVQPVMTALRRIADNTNSGVILIHHSGKTGKMYRGSSVIKASSDLMIQIKSKSDSPIVSFKTEKNRDGTFTNWSANATWGENVFYLKHVSLINKNISNREEYILSYLKEHDESSITELVNNSIDYSKHSIRKSIYTLVEKGKIVRSNPEEGNKIARYILIS